MLCRAYQSFCRHKIKGEIEALPAMSITVVVIFWTTMIYSFMTTSISLTAAVRIAHNAESVNKHFPDSSQLNLLCTSPILHSLRHCRLLQGIQQIDLFADTCIINRICYSHVSLSW